MNKTATKLFAALMFTAMVLSAVPLLNMTKAAPFPPFPDIHFEPSTPTFYDNTTFVGSTFVETLYVVAIGNTFAYQFEVDFNSTQLNCTSAVYSAGATSQFFAGHTTVTTGPYIDDIGGKITGGEMLLDSDVVARGSASIINMTFMIMQGPPIGGTVSSIITVNNPNTFFLDPSLTQVTGLVFIDALYTYNWARANPYDINRDGKVDMKDIAIAAKAFGTSPSDPRWNLLADVNGDGKVDMRDIALIARHFGDHYP